MSFVRVTGYLPGGTVPITVAWRDSRWRVTPGFFSRHVRALIRDAIQFDCPGGMIGQSPTGPFFSVTSREGGRLLALGLFAAIDDIESDFDLPALESVPGRVYGPPLLSEEELRRRYGPEITEGWRADAGLERRMWERLRGVYTPPLTVKRPPRPPRPAL